jgi:UDP-2,3-diacylglucosamine pyrophosphatase LpxH
MISAFPPAEGLAKIRFRSVFISDVHLGSSRAQAERLLHFLERCQSEFLYLVGDIVDGARETAGWPSSHHAVLVAMRRKASQGTRVHYLRGNHDGRFEELWGREAELCVSAEVEHTTADGKRLLVLHGDSFDSVVARRWLSHGFDALARLLERAGSALERVLRRRRRALGVALKETCKRALGYTGRFERSAVRWARNRRLDGVICGHVHSAASRTIDGLYYGNGGDWVSSCTALVEHPDGRLELVSWSSLGTPGSSLAPCGS